MTNTHTHTHTYVVSLSQVKKIVQISLLMGNTKKERKIRNIRKRRNEGREKNKGKDGREYRVWDGEIN